MCVLVGATNPCSVITAPHFSSVGRLVSGPTSPTPLRPSHARCRASGIWSHLVPACLSADLLDIERQHSSKQNGHWMRFAQFLCRLIHVGCRERQHRSKAGVGESDYRAANGDRVSVQFAVGGPIHLPQLRHEAFYLLLWLI